MSQINGALAQLGERYTGSVEVSGSSPLCSILETLDTSRVSFLLLFLKIVQISELLANRFFSDQYQCFLDQIEQYTHFSVT